MLLLKLSLLPAVLFCIYIYIYDKDKEPFYTALLCIIYGLVSYFPIALTAAALSLSLKNSFLRALYEAFITAALPEELMKLAVLYLLVYGFKTYDAFFDGIFYSVFLCMGFAAAENTGYVFHPVLGGLKTAVLRSIFSVPCHGIFAVLMGFYVSEAKFRKKSMFFAFAVPFFLHGLYDFILLYSFPYSGIIFLLYFAFLIFLCFRIKHRAG